MMLCICVRVIFACHMAQEINHLSAMYSFLHISITRRKATKTAMMDTTHEKIDKFFKNAVSGANKLHKLKKASLSKNKEMSKRNAQKIKAKIACKKEANKRGKK